MPFQHDIAGGQGNLIVTSLQSPGFLPGVGGWQVRRDGSVEFNNGTFRGTIKGGTLIISQGSGATFEQFEIDGSTGTTTWSKYQSPSVVIRQILADGTDLTYNDPGNGNPQGALLISSSAKTGTAIDGTNYGHGVFFWQPGTSAIGISAAGGQPILDMSAPNRTHATSDAGLFTETLNAGAVNEEVLTVLSSGKESGNADAALQLFSASADATISAKAIIEFGGAIFATFDSAGALTIIDGADGQTYQTQRKSIVLANSTACAAPPGTVIFSSAVSARTYRIHGLLFLSISGAAQQVSVNVTMPGVANGQVATVLSRASTLVATTNFGLNSLTGLGAAASLAVGNVYVLLLDGTMVVPSSGTFTITVAGTNANDITVAKNSAMDIEPV